MSSLPAVEVIGVSREFDVSRPWLSRVFAREPRRYLTAVQDVTFEIARARTFGLVGESGSGKTTVARMVVGLLPPTAGDVSVDGVSLIDPGQAAERQRLRRRIHMVFQDPYASLNPRWRIERIIAEPIRAFGLAHSNEAVTERVDELLDLVGLHAADRFRFPHEFSGGQRQRVAIARALASSAELIVCDEPTSALDVSVQAQILNLMRDLQERFDLTYLLISHDLAVVRHMADRIGVMYLGRVVEIGDAGALFRSPRHPYTRMLLEGGPGRVDAGAPGCRDRGRDPEPHRSAPRMPLPSALPARLRPVPPRGPAVHRRGRVPRGPRRPGRGVARQCRPNHPADPLRAPGERAGTIPLVRTGRIHGDSLL